MDTKLRAAAYLRVSTTQQDEATQLPDIEAQIENDNAELIKNGIFRDRISGLKDEKDRSGLNDLLKLTNKDIDIVYIWEISRLSRKPSDFLKLVESFKGKGINICFLKPTPIYLIDKNTGNVDLSISIMLSVYSNVAEFEIKQKSQRTQRGRNEAIFTRNESYAGNVPFGYKKVNKKLVINDEDVVSSIEGFRTPSEVVKRIFEMYNDGITPVHIARKLNEYNIQTNYNQTVKKDIITFNSGKQTSKDRLIWRKQTVNLILNNTTYTGYKIVNTNVKTDRMDENQHYIINHSERKISTPAIIDENVFLAAQETKRLNIKRASKSNKTEYMLRGLLRCGKCGDYYVGTSYTGSTIYRCADVTKRETSTYKGCKGFSINSHRLDYMIWNSIKSDYTVVSFIDYQNKGRNDILSGIENIKQLINIKEKAIKDKTRRLSELTKMILDASSNRIKELYINEQNEVDKELTRLELELKDLKIKESALVKELRHIDKLIEDSNSKLHISDYDISDVESSFSMKKDAIKRVVKDIVLYEAKENDTINKTTYKGYRRLFILDVSLYNDWKIFIIYNPFSGTFARLHSLDNEIIFDKDNLVFKIEKIEPSEAILSYSKDYERVGLSLDNLLYDIKHPVELFNDGNNLEIPKRQHINDKTKYI